jgi:RHS repeat-associated protein
MKMHRLSVNHKKYNFFLTWAALLTFFLVDPQISSGQCNNQCNAWAQVIIGSANWYQFVNNCTGATTKTPDASAIPTLTSCNPVTAYAGAAECTGGTERITYSDSSGSEVKIEPDTGGVLYTFSNPKHSGSITVTAISTDGCGDMAQAIGVIQVNPNGCNPCNASSPSSLSSPGGSSPGGGSSSPQTYPTPSCGSGNPANNNDNGLEFDVALGQGLNGSDAGYLAIQSVLPSTNLSQPTGLQLTYLNTPGVTNITNVSGVISQVLSPQGLVVVTNLTSYEYELGVFDATNVTGFSSGKYTFSGTPIVTWIIQNTNGVTSSNTLSITEERSGSTNRVFQYSYNTSGGWNLLEPDGMTTISNWQSVSGTITNMFWDTLSGTNVINRVGKSFQYNSAISNVLTIGTSVGTGTLAQITTNTYYGSDPTNGASTNLIQMAQYPAGRWIYYVYDDSSRVATTYESYNNSPAPTPNTVPDPTVLGCKETTYAYDDFGDDATITPWAPRQTVVQVPDSSLNLVEISRTYNFYNYEEDNYGNNLLKIETQQCAVPGALPDDPNSIISYTRTYVADINGTDPSYTAGTCTNLFRYGRPRSASHLDGTVTIYDYGTNSAGQLFVTNCTGVIGGSGSWTEPGNVANIVDGTKTVTISDSLGRILSKTSIDILSGDTISSATYTYLDATVSGRDYQVVDLAGRTNTFTYDCCGLESATDPDGVVTDYNYDAMKRPVSAIVYRGSGGIEMLNTLDGAGRVLITQRIGTNGSPITLIQNQYDVLGRVTATTNALGGVTTMIYSPTNVQQCITNTYSDGGTRIELSYLDGRLESVIGSALHGVGYQYGPATNVNGSICTYTTATKLNADGSSSSEWTESYVDMAGRATEMLYADGSYSQSIYNPQNQMTNQIDPDGIMSIYQFNDKGELAYTALDMARDWTMDFSGTNRINFTTNDVVSDHGTHVLRTRNYVWATASVNTSNLLSAFEVSANGLTNWQSIYPDGVTAVTSTSVTSPGINRINTMTAPDGSSTVSLYSYGWLISVTKYDSMSVQIGETTYTYDAQGRQSTVTDARNGTTVYSFNNADQVVSEMTPNPGSIAGSPETTMTDFDTLMRPTGIVYPDGTTLTNIYYQTGQILSTSGSRTYSVGYSYDYAGRTKTMTNWSNFATLAGARVTTNNYDAYRGFPTSKVYADGNGPSYTYTAAGRLAVRKWARGVNTTNSYNPAGDLAKVIYNDGTTPGVTNTYDRLGRISSVVCGATTTGFVYDLANDVLSESYTGGLLGGLTVTNQFDSVLRRINIALLSGSTTLCRTTNTYDNASRLATVSDGTNSAAYSYLANSSLVSNIVFKSNMVTRMTTIKQYDYLNRLSSISSTPSNAFTYQYNAANQRTLNQLADGSYWRYGYDALGQVIQGIRYWADETVVAGQQFDYAFDTIGNRTQAQAGGDQNGANLRLANYTNNSLNQLTSRGVPAAVDVMGLGLATNAVTVNGSTAYRKNEYFRDQLSVTNSSAAVWDSITVAATGQTSVTGHSYVAKQPETYLYDLDGNLLSNGRWTNTWDGENRLVSMTSLSGAPSGSLLQLNFSYDFVGRRIQKIVSTNGSGTNYVGEYTNKFAYDGWNCVAILSPALSLSNSFMWGSDLSGSLQGAGGVGGLLKVAYYGTVTTNCFVGYDGNGNVSALINTADGTALANYEYGPFGEVIRLSGPMAKLNPFRFSTKYDDDETDLLYYGYRYYNPFTGRWLSRDPLAEEAFLTQFCRRKNSNKRARLRAQYLNPVYVFAQNEPIDWFDLLGLDDGHQLENKCKCSMTCADKEALRIGLLKAADFLDTLIGKTYTTWADFQSACAPAHIQAIGQTDGLFGGHLTGAGNLTDGQKCIVKYFESHKFTQEPGNGDQAPFSQFNGSMEEYINDWIPVEEGRIRNAATELAGAEKLEGCPTYGPKPVSPK